MFYIFFLTVISLFPQSYAATDIDQLVSQYHKYSPSLRKLTGRQGRPPSHGAPTKTGRQGAPSSHGAPQTTNGAPQTTNGAPQTTNGSPQTTNGSPQTTNGAPQKTNGAPQTAQGAPITPHGAPPARSKRVPQFTKSKNDQLRVKRVDGGDQSSYGINTANNSIRRDSRRDSVEDERITRLHSSDDMHWTEMDVDKERASWSGSSVEQRDERRWEDLERTPYQRESHPKKSTFHNMVAVKQVVQYPKIKVKLVKPVKDRMRNYSNVRTEKSFYFRFPRDKEEVVKRWEKHYYPIYLPKKSNKDPVRKVVPKEKPPARSAKFKPPKRGTVFRPRSIDPVRSLPGDAELVIQEEDSGGSGFDPKKPPKRETVFGNNDM